MSFSTASFCSGDIVPLVDRVSEFTPLSQPLKRKGSTERVPASQREVHETIVKSFVSCVVLGFPTPSEIGESIWSVVSDVKGLTATITSVSCCSWESGLLRVFLSLAVAFLQLRYSSRIEQRRKDQIVCYRH